MWGISASRHVTNNLARDLLLHFSLASLSDCVLASSAIKIKTSKKFNFSHESLLQISMHIRTHTICVCTYGFLLLDHGYLQFSLLSLSCFAVRFKHIDCWNLELGGR